MEESNFVAMMVKSIAALAGVLAIFAGLVWGLRRLQHATMPQKGVQMKVIQRLHLDARNSIVEIKHGEQHYLLGVGQGGIQKIADVDVPLQQDTLETPSSESKHA